MIIESMNILILVFQLLLLNVALIGNCKAFDSQSSENQASASIQQLYHKLKNIPNNQEINTRIEWISAQFLGRPYELGALGEGPNAKYDQYPQYRIDAFDCDTFVNTVIALAFANSFPNFQKCINHMRYQDAKVCYLKRLHFTGLDWNNYHQANGNFKDITHTIVNKSHNTIFKQAIATVNKSRWYAFKNIDSIRLQNTNASSKVERLSELKSKTAHLKSAKEKINYLPLDQLFTKNMQAKSFIFDQIPSGAIIEIVRPNWNLEDKIGTRLNISHLGFAIRTGGILYFRETSSLEGKVIDIPLIKYLQFASKSATIKGINIQIVTPGRALRENCT